MADLCAKLPIHVVVKVDRAPTDLASDVAPVQRRCNSQNITDGILQVNIWKITDIWTAKNNIKTFFSDHRSYTHTLRSCKNKAWQQQQQQQKGLNGIRAHDLRCTGALLYQLSYQVTLWSYCELVIRIIIHSKYFPVSDWLKPHAYFTITSCSSPNLERIFAIFNQWRQKWSPPKIIEPMTSKVQPTADYWTVDGENLGTRLCYIWWAEKQRA